MPAASAAAAPPLEPPGVRVVSCGLRVAPKSRFSVVGRMPISGVFVLPISTAPARRRRAMQVASVDGHVVGERARPVGRRVRRRVVQILGRERHAVQRPAPDVRQAVALARLGERALAVPGDHGADARVLGLEPLERLAAGLLGRRLGAHAVTPRAAQQLAHALVRQARRAAAVRRRSSPRRRRARSARPPRWPARRPRRTDPCATHGTKRSDAVARPPRRASSPIVSSPWLRRREGEEDVAREVRSRRARAREAERHAPRERLALARQQRRVGGDDRDHGAGAGGRVPRRVGHRIVVGELAADGDAGDHELLRRAEVGLHEDAHANTRRSRARRRARPSPTRP